jgi:hypothetical protein
MTHGVYDFHREIDTDIEACVFGRSALLSWIAPREFTTDPRACKILIDLLDEVYAWFDIRRVETDDEPLNMDKWEVCLINFKALTGRGATMEEAVCNVCLLAEVSSSLLEHVNKLEKENAKV